MGLPTRQLPMPTAPSATDKPVGAWATELQTRLANWIDQAALQISTQATTQTGQAAQLTKLQTQVDTQAKEIVALQAAVKALQPKPPP